MCRRSFGGALSCALLVLSFAGGALAGETITFQARHVGEAGADHELACRAVSGSKLIGEMRLTLTAAGRATAN